jgi:hypothetical protein
VTASLTVFGEQHPLAITREILERSSIEPGEIALTGLTRDLRHQHAVIVGLRQHQPAIRQGIPHC